MITVGIGQISNSTNIEENFKAICGLIERFESAGVDLVLFPECGLSGFTSKIRECTKSVLQPYLEEIQKLSAKAAMDVVLPTAIVEEGGIFNSGFWFKNEGRHQFYKLGLTDSEKKFFATPPAQSSKVFEKNGYRFGILVCYEAEHAPWTYFDDGTVDAILWPGYWGWTVEMGWSAYRDQDRANPIFQNMTHWKCPLLQANFANNNLGDGMTGGPEGLSYIVNTDNTLVHRGLHLKEDGFVVNLEKVHNRVTVNSCRQL